MTPEERLITAAKTVAKMKHLHTIADKFVREQWDARRAAVAAIEKEYNVTCDVAKTGREVTYQRLSAAQREYDKALIAIHKATLEEKP